MTVTVTSKTSLTVPPKIQRRVGIRPGDRVEFRVSGGIIHIIPELPSADDEYTPEQRKIMDAQLAEARKAPHGLRVDGLVLPKRMFCLPAARHSRGGADVAAESLASSDDNELLLGIERHRAQGFLTSMFQNPCDSLRENSPGILLTICLDRWPPGTSAQQATCQAYSTAAG